MLVYIVMELNWPQQRLYGRLVYWAFRFYGTSVWKILALKEQYFLSRLEN